MRIIKIPKTHMQGIIHNQLKARFGTMLGGSRLKPRVRLEPSCF